MSDAARLLVQAERCFRLARGPASAKLADELEALGRGFEREARKVEASLLHRSVQWRGAEATRSNTTDCLINR
jgi:hypothetical protein